MKYFRIKATLKKDGLIGDEVDTAEGRKKLYAKVDSPTYNNIYLEKSDNSELLLAKNVPAGSRVMSP